MLASNVPILTGCCDERGLGNHLHGPPVEDGWNLSWADKSGHDACAYRARAAGARGRAVSTRVHGSLPGGSLP